MAYLRAHWTGQHPLGRCLLVNTLLIGAAIVLVLQLLVPQVLRRQWLGDTQTLIALLVLWLVVIVWQSVGSFRAAGERIKRYGSATDFYIVLGTTVATVMVVFIHLVSLGSDSFDQEQAELDIYKPPPKSYKLTMDSPDTYRLEGEIDHGATANLSRILERHPNTTTLVLDSIGGVIVESRGIARLIREYKLNTHVENVCASGCTLAFISGNKRSMADGAQLGFHQYALQEDSPYPWIDPHEEQARDRALFESQSVAGWFMDKMFDAAHEELWTPDENELRRAGVINHVLR